MTHRHNISSRWRCVGSATLVALIGAGGDRLRPGSAEFRELLFGFVVAGRAQLGASLVDREVFWTVIARRRLLVDLACGETQEELVD